MQPLNILVVDDELGMRMGIERCLKNVVFEFPEFGEQVSLNITTVDTGNKALEALQKSLPDIILLDHKLPDLSGLDILNKIESEKLDVLSIMITAFASLEVAISATKKGAFDFLAKPFTPEEVRDRIKKAAKSIYLKRKAQALEAEKKQVRFQFISILAHELKSPIAAVEGYLRMIEEKTSGEDIDSYMMMVQRSINRLEGMRKLINDILDLTRIESGNKKRELKKLDIVDITNKIIENYKYDALNKGITISLNAPADYFYNADQSEMEMVIGNLVSNAIKYNKKDGHVEISISTKDNALSFICQDNGIGMSPEELKKLFQEFSRIKNEKTKNIPGSGLGLSIIKKVVDNYSGNIKVESASDKGTTFFILLPF